MPSVSLIRNIGFSDDATHTVGSPCKIKESELAFPLRINSDIIADHTFDYKL